MQVRQWCFRLSAVPFNAGSLFSAVKIRVRSQVSAGPTFMR